MKLLELIRRKLAGMRNKAEKRVQRRLRAKRRRRRVVEWDAFSSRHSGDARKCALCDAARGRATALVQLILAGGRGLIRPAARLPRPAPANRPLEGGADARRVFLRRAYPGSRTRRFHLHLPSGYREGSAAPLLVVLHGCRQDHADIRRISEFDAIAEREGFITMYPFVTGYSGLRIRNCWGWWIESEILPGAGEVEDLWHMVEQVREEVHVDEHRIHIAGLSSGGGMAVAAMVVHHDRFASGATVAGVPYAETARAVDFGAPGGVRFRPVSHLVAAMKTVMGEQGRPSPVMIVHSANDELVDIQAARNIRDSWAGCFGIDTAHPVVKGSGNTAGASWVHSGYRESRKRSAIETLFMEGPGHGWYGGAPGRFSFPAAPSASEFIWRFLARHPLYTEARQSGGDRRPRKAG